MLVVILQPDGEDYMRSHVRILVEDMVRRFPDRPAYKYEYVQEMPEGTLHEAGEKGNGQLVAAGDGSEVECHSGIPPYFLWRLLKVNDSPENRDYLAGLSEQYLKQEECAMEDQRPGPAQPYPWYDDRVEAVRKEYVNRKIAD